MAAAGGGEKFTIKAETVMSDQGSVPRPRGELAQHIFRPIGICNVAISHAGVALDER